MYWSEFDRGGHFAALEAPELLIGDVGSYYAGSDDPVAELSSAAIMLAVAAALVSAGAGVAGVDPPVRVTLDGVGGARPGMSVEAVPSALGLPLRPTYEVRPGCGQAPIAEPGLEGYAIFMPRGRFGAVFLRRGAVTGKGIGIGSTVVNFGAHTPTYPRPDRYIHGGRHYFLRRARAPHWHLRLRLSPAKRVTQIAFGNRESVPTRRRLRVGARSLVAPESPVTRAGSPRGAHPARRPARARAGCARRSRRTR